MSDLSGRLSSVGSLLFRVNVSDPYSSAVNQSAEVIRSSVFNAVNAGGAAIRTAAAGQRDVVHVE